MTRRIVLVIAAALALGACRSATAPEHRGPAGSPLAPSPVRVQDDAARAGMGMRVAATESERSQVPVVVRIESAADPHGIHFRLHLAPEQFGDAPYYAPGAVGGWQFQLFLNVDRDLSTGYASGYEFLTRDSEADLDPDTVVLRRTEGGGGPGGWGDEVARLPIQVAPRLLMFTVPLQAIEDDGVVDFGLELYATVAGGLDGSTPVAHFVRDYTGSSIPRRRDDPGPPDPVTAQTPGVSDTEGRAALPMDRLASKR